MKKYTAGHQRTSPTPTGRHHHYILATDIHTCTNSHLKYVIRRQQMVYFRSRARYIFFSFTVLFLHIKWITALELLHVFKKCKNYSIVVNLALV